MPIDFANPNWQRIFAESFIQIVETPEVADGLCRISIGGTIVADRVNPSDPRVAFARQIAEELPQKFLYVAAQAVRSMLMKNPKQS